ncbi:MAG: protein translocase subunit SecD [Pyrinomonadaceae bacterium]
MKRRNFTVRVVIIALISIVALYIVIGPHRSPRPRDFTLRGIRQNLADNIRLGLDLKGGSRLVMQVQTAEYLKRLTADASLTAQNAVKESGVAVKEIRPETAGEEYKVVVEATDNSKLNELRDLVNKKIGTQQWSPSISGNTITWTMTREAQRVLSTQAVDQARTIIDSRINSFGVAEPTLATHGAAESHQLLLEMPGIQDPERVKSLLVAESKLELVHVISAPNPAPAQTYASEAEAIQSLGGRIPPNNQVLSYVERDALTTQNGAPDMAVSPEEKEKQKRYVVVQFPPVIDGSELRNAQAVTRTSGINDYQIEFSLKPSGAEKFGLWTGANIGQYMGVVLNGEVKSIAWIKSQITDSGEISGKFSKSAGEDLALTLRSGALPAPLTYLEERTVGPSLGADSIRAGVTASIVGLALVISFMLFYYRGSGLNAVVALVMNIVLTVGALIIFKATLTLPGIAGLILTIGMAVDSNVLIFERIREELHSGKTVASSIDVGFAKAFVTIIDTHVTAIISSLFLFLFGTGPIRGFAVTLVLGLLANLFTAVYVSRTIYIWILNRREERLRELSI